MTIFFRPPPQELAKRHALGLPVEAEDGEGPKDPHEVLSSAEEDEIDYEELEEGGGGKKEGVSWSYSGYMHALDEEEVLNEVDETTFGCVSNVVNHTGKITDNFLLIVYKFFTFCP